MEVLKYINSITVPIIKVYQNEPCHNTWLLIPSQLAS